MLNSIKTTSETAIQVEEQLEQRYYRGLIWDNVSILKCAESVHGAI